jgi:hypothetical protein
MDEADPAGAEVGGGEADGVPETVPGAWREAQATTRRTDTVASAETGRRMAEDTSLIPHPAPGCGQPLGLARVE